jgi:acyl-CoA thioesterase FadM
LIVRADPPPGAERRAIDIATAVRRPRRRQVVDAAGALCHGREDHQLRMQMRQVLVTTSLDNHQAIEIPRDIRQAIEAALAAKAR